MELETALSKFWATMGERLHTGMPAVVESWDKSTGRARVRPTCRLMLGVGIAVEIPVIDNVPVIFPQCAAFRIEFPLTKGDPIWLTFSECSLGEWLQSDGKSVVSPEDSSRFSLTDAVAFVGISPQGGIKSKGSIVVAQDGTITINSHLEISP